MCDLNHIRYNKIINIKKGNYYKNKKIVKKRRKKFFCPENKWIPFYFYRGTTL